MNLVHFSKYHGAGNDFILIDNRDLVFNVNSQYIRMLCDRHFGIGADGLMLLENHSEFDFTMRYFNADGGEATLCGNGGRCISAFAHQLGVVGSTAFFLASDGPHKAQIFPNGLSYMVELQMNDIVRDTVDSDYSFLNTGSPHHVQWVDEVSNMEVFQHGSQIRFSEHYKGIGGTNVNFVEILDSNQLKIRTYERGVENETLACGTGAVASAILFALKNNLKEGPVVLRAVGGDLTVNFSIEPNNVTNIVLSGPAVKVFEGTIKF
ncbi:MAG: diaminopimelate epimerase [Bacteroidales bacterium]|nr:diaminopimelate epimerase [Bacteroidales bacterium]